MTAQELIRELRALRRVNVEGCGEYNGTRVVDLTVHENGEYVMAADLDELLDSVEALFQMQDPRRRVA